jgi:transcriptional regulator with XRE-family HTH domain
MEFDAKARTYYYSAILCDRRKELIITQNELAETTGMARSYITNVERGKTDIRLSSFLRIVDSLSLAFSPKVVISYRFAGYCTTCTVMQYKYASN